MTTFQPSLNGLSFICEPVCSDLRVKHYVLKENSQRPEHFAANMKPKEIVFTNKSEHEYLKKGTA